MSLERQVRLKVRGCFVDILWIVGLALEDYDRKFLKIV